MKYPTNSGPVLVLRFVFVTAIVSMHCAMFQQFGKALAEMKLSE